LISVSHLRNLCDVELEWTNAYYVLLLKNYNWMICTLENSLKYTKMVISLMDALRTQVFDLKKELKHNISKHWMHNFQK